MIKTLAVATLIGNGLLAQDLGRVGEQYNFIRNLRDYSAYVGILGGQIESLREELGKLDKKIISFRSMRDIVIEEDCESCLETLEKNHYDCEGCDPIKTPHFHNDEDFELIRSLETKIRGNVWEIPYGFGRLEWITQKENLDDEDVWEIGIYLEAIPRMSQEIIDWKAKIVEIKSKYFPWEKIKELEEKYGELNGERFVRQSELDFMTGGPLGYFVVEDFEVGGEYD